MKNKEKKILKAARGKTLYIEKNNSESDYCPHQKYENQNNIFKMLGEWVEFIYLKFNIHQRYSFKLKANKNIFR